MTELVGGRCFADADLAGYVSEMYGPVMGCKVEDFFADDPGKESRFVNSIRHSLTREIAARIERRAARGGAQEVLDLRGAA